MKPNNNLLCISSDLDFEWTPSTDFEGEEISYFYQVSKDNMFTSIDKSGTLREAQKKLQLDKETAYYWRVQAIDSNGIFRDMESVYRKHSFRKPLAVYADTFKSFN